MNYKTPTNERKYHYWRGFTVAIALSVFMFIAINVLYKPDYTMTPAQYQAYVTACTSK